MTRRTQLRGQYLVDGDIWTQRDDMSQRQPVFQCEFLVTPLFLCMVKIRWTFKKCNCLVRCSKKEKLLQSDSAAAL